MADRGIRSFLRKIGTGGIILSSSAGGVDCPIVEAGDLDSFWVLGQLPDRALFIQYRDLPHRAGRRLTRQTVVGHLLPPVPDLQPTTT